MIGQDPKHWAGALDRDTPIFVRSDMAASDIREVTWFDWCLPTYSQDGDSCVGHSWANWLECMLRRRLGPEAIHRGMQVDGHAIWRRGREMFWGGKMTGGLYLDQGCLAAVDLGILSKSAAPVRIERTISAQSLQLRDTPLVVGHAVHAGWYNPSRENGCIDHAPRPDGSGYHATLRVGVLYQGNSWYYAGQNSWGSDWGWRGYFLMTASEDQEGAMQDSPWTCADPGGPLFGPNWKNYLVGR
jgi:hypothetical protein